MNPRIRPVTALRRQAIDTFLRSRKIPRGAHRDDLRQLAYALFRLHLRASGCQGSKGFFSILIR